MNYKNFEQALQARIDFQQQLCEIEPDNDEALKIKHVLEMVRDDYKIYQNDNIDRDKND